MEYRRQSGMSIRIAKKFFEHFVPQCMMQKVMEAVMLIIIALVLAISVIEERDFVSVIYVNTGGSFR